MAKGKRHEWRERGENGEIIIYRAWCYGGEWQMNYTLKSEADWHAYDPIPKEALLKLREKVWEKYQRNRVPFKHIEQLDAMIEEAPVEVNFEEDPEPTEEPPEPTTTDEPPLVGE